MARGPPVSPVQPPHSEGMLQTQCAVCSGSLCGLVFMSELLRMCLALMMILILEQFLIHVNFSEIPFTSGIYTELTDSADCYPWN
jgi:hypothetical protein